jgi:hypothetical protein
VAIGRIYSDGRGTTGIEVVRFAAEQVLDEVKRDGTAARRFESPSGNMTRVVISLG